MSWQCSTYKVTGLQLSIFSCSWFRGWQLRFRSNSTRVRPRKTRVSGQEPRQGGFSKRGFCRILCHVQENRKYARILGPTIHLGHSDRHSQESRTCLQKPLLKTPFFLLPESEEVPLNKTAENAELLRNSGTPKTQKNAADCLYCQQIP